MEARVIRLEESAKVADARMGRVEDKLDTVIERLGRLPSRLDMLGYLIGTVAAFLALTAVIVTSMGWLETRASRVQPPSPSAPQPIVIQLPSNSLPIRHP